MENKLVGAKKRKAYKQNKSIGTLSSSRASKESTPGDRYANTRPGSVLQDLFENFIRSGFIETIDLSSERSGTPTLPAFKKHHFDILDLILEEFDVIEPKLKAMQVFGPRRSLTARQAALESKRSPSWQLLQMIIKRRLAKRTETNEEAVARFSPDVGLKRLSKEQIQRLTRPWGFLDKIEVKDKYKFTAKVIKTRKVIKSNDPDVLVQWSPPGILEDEWMKKSELPEDGGKVVNVTNFSWRQKLLIGGHVAQTAEEPSDTEMSSP